MLIDVDPLTYTITASDLKAVLQEPRAFEGHRAAAVIPVHLYGNPADMSAILDVAARHGLRVVEDCAAVDRGENRRSSRGHSATSRPSASTRRRIWEHSATAASSPRTTPLSPRGLSRSANTAGRSGSSARSRESIRGSMKFRQPCCA